MPLYDTDNVTVALGYVFASDTEKDATEAPGANVVDGLFAIARAIDNLASATRGEVKPGS